MRTGKLNLVNERFERLLVIAKAEKVNGRTAYRCRCDCGSERIVMSQSLRSGATKSCGCLHKDITVGTHKQRAEELLNKRFSHWTVKALTSRRSRKGGIYFLCVCDCGQEREVTAESLLGNRSKSCGCGHKEPFCKRGHEVVKFGGRTPSGSCKACVKEKSLLRNYGINLPEYEALWESQKGLCAICGKSLGRLFEIGEQGWGRGGRAEVDHKHGVKLPKKQTVRGLLCGGRWAGCNRKLGRIDNPEWLKKVISYLESPPAEKVFPK